MRKKDTIRSDRGRTQQREQRKTGQMPQQREQRRTGQTPQQRGQRRTGQTPQQRGQRRTRQTPQQREQRRMQQMTRDQIIQPARIPDKEDLRDKKRKKRKRILRVQIAVLCLILLAAAYVIYDKVMDGRSMGCRIAVSGLSVSWLSEEKAAEKIAEKFENVQIKFKEEGDTVYQVSLGEAGYSLDQDALVQELTNLRNQRTSCHSLFEKYKNYEIPYRVNVQEEKKKSAFAASHFDAGKERKDSEDAHIKYNEETDRYDIIDHMQGNQIDEGKLLAKVQEYLDNSFSKALLKDPVEFELDIDVYQTPEVDEKQEALLRRQEELNTKLQNYPKTSVTYTFGDVTEVLNQDTIQGWVIKEEDNIRLDEDAVWEFIYDLATKYNTLYIPRYLESSNGYTVQIDNNEYGYEIDQQAEFDRLIQDLESGTAVEREPIYSHEAPGRNGDDDLLGNYVEVSLEQQHLWMYKDGVLVVESDIVSGQPVGINKTTGEQEDWSTYKGAYPIAYKESPATLSSDIYGYETDVEYWMPFVEGQGLHDASWRGAFGGTIYQTDGSHGCINLPSYVAAEIFSYITQGYAVLIY